MTPARAPDRIIVAMTGASGFDYGIEILRLLADLGVETHLVVSRGAITAMAHETDWTYARIRELAVHCHDSRDLAAPIASGSFRTAGMIVAPCSAKSLAEIACGIGGNLVSRAADVVLKERRRLVLMFRETPLHLGHCRNMTAVTEMGGIVMPPVPAFYPRPKTIEEIISYTAVRALDLMGFDVPTGGRWKED